MRHTPTLTTAGLLAAGILAAGLLAGCDDVDPEAAATPADTGDPRIEVTGTNELLWLPFDIEVAAGTVEVRVDCGTDRGHEFAIEGVQGGAPIATCEPAGTGFGTVQLDPGTYTFFCAVPGHRENGMDGDLTVTG